MSIKLNFLNMRGRYILLMVKFLFLIFQYIKKKLFFDNFCKNKKFYKINCSENFNVSHWIIKIDYLINIT